MSQKTIKYIFVSSLVLLFLASGYLQVWLARHETQTIDEGVHISAGYSYITTGDFRLNPEHPPLAKQLAALPLLFVKPTLPTNTTAWAEAEQWQFAHDFLYESGNNPQQILFLGRIPMIILALILGLCIARWTYELAGKIPSLVSSVLYVSSPLFLTHGHLIATDVPVTLGVTAAAYFFVKSLRSKSWKWVLLTAVATAFASDVKFTGLILFGLIPVLYALVYLFAGKRLPHLSSKHFLVLFGSMIVATFLLASLTTGFQVNVSSHDPFLGMHHIEQAKEFIIEFPSAFRWFPRFYLWVLEHVHFVAYPYASGLFEFITHFEVGHESYFLGNYDDMGNIWYFPVAFLIKTRLAVLVLLSLILTLFVKRTYWAWKFKLYTFSFKKKLRQWAEGWNPELFILVGLPALFFVSALQSKVNIGVRHILIVYPFLYILVSLLWSVRIHRQRIFRWLITAVLAVALISTAAVWPFPMTYFSEAVGGASQGHKYIMNSNLDWGQNLFYLRDYLHNHDVDTICFGYFGQGQLSDLGIHIRPLYSNRDVTNFGTPDCVVVVSVQVLYNKEQNFTWLQKLTPNAVIGDSFYIYDLRNQVTN